MPAIISMSSGPYSASDLFEFQRNLWEGVRAKSRQASAASLGGGEGEGVTPNQFVVDSTAHTSLLPVPKRHGGCDESSEEESWEPVKHHRHHHQRRRQQQPHDDVVEAEAPLRNEVLEEREEHEAEEMKHEEEASSEEEEHLSPLNVKGMFGLEAEAACDEDLRGSDRMAHTQRVHQNRASQRHTTHEHRKCSKPGSCVANQGKFCAACRPALGARLIRVDTAKAQAREAQLYGNWRDYSRYGPG